MEKIIKTKRVPYYLKFIKRDVLTLNSTIWLSFNPWRYLLVISTVSCPNNLDRLYTSNPFLNCAWA